MVRGMLGMASVVVLLAPSLPGEAAAPSFELGVAVKFGGQAHRQAAQMAAAGIRWVRTDLAWSHAERERGSYDFTTWDRLLEAFDPHGIQLLLILDYGNELYGGGFPPLDEPSRAAFAAFAGAAARHFRGRVAWEVWNEPNVPRFWVGEPDAEAYVALARAAAAAIRREDPKAWILGPALGGDTFDGAYLEQTLRRGLLEVVDAVSIHPYAAANPEAARPLYESVRTMIARHAPGRDVPIVVTEWGYPASAIGPQAQADYLLRALAVNRQAGIPLTIWYDWQEPVLPWDSFGLFDVRGQAKPAYQALQALQTKSSRR
jgi:hypothetical protein